MEATELRIGNFLQEKITNEVFKVSSSFFTLLDLNLKTSNPIPLTEEWLVKFGLELNESDVIYFERHSFQLHLWSDINKFIYVFTGGNVFINYVHTLQNLYYALTGEELCTN